MSASGVVKDVSDNRHTSMTNHHPDSSLVAYVCLSLSHMGAGEAMKDASGDTSSSRCSVSSAPVPRDGVLSSARRLVAATDTKPVVKNNPPPPPPPPPPPIRKGVGAVSL